MIKDFPGEKWKAIEFDFDFTNECRIEISNYGRLRTFNKISNGNIIQGSMINGYRIIRLKLFKAREENTQIKITGLQIQVADLTKQMNTSVKENADKQLISEQQALLNPVRKKLNKVYKEDLKQRTINYHSLIHRLVANYFLPAPSPGKTIVAHIDYNKLNNRVTNLKWMTPEENYIHQQNSPHVIKEKQQRQLGSRQNTKVAKLTVTRVMLLKKLIGQNKPMKQLIKQFKITDTQILRIKRGENWKHIPAAN